jgi:hypothetical protein
MLVVVVMVVNLELMLQFRPYFTHKVPHCVNAATNVTIV